MPDIIHPASGIVDLLRISPTGRCCLRHLQTQTLGNDPHISLDANLYVMGFFATHHDLLKCDTQITLY